MTSRHAFGWNLAFALLLGPASLGAQAPAANTLRSDQEAVLVRGRVTDLTTGRALPAASLEALDLEAGGRLVWEGMSDSTGAFLGPRLPPSTYRLRVDALGYGPVTHVMTLSGYGEADLQIELAPVALELEPLVVVSRRRSRLETAGFYERRNRGFGHSFTREEIEARRPGYVSDIVRTMPGVTVGPGRMGGGGLIRMRGGCTPDVILDGVSLAGPVRLDDILTVDNLEGIEVYSGSTSPIEYSRSSCGTVLAWTRDPVGVPGRPWSWKRAGVAAGFLLLGFLLAG